MLTKGKRRAGKITAERHAIARVHLLGIGINYGVPFCADRIIGLVEISARRAKARPMVR